MKKRDLLVLGVAGLVAAAAGLYMALKRKQERQEDTPPKQAPQLHLDNPGDQSEFPAAPHDKRDLG